MKIGIIGAGSIGSLFGGYLAYLAQKSAVNADMEVEFFGREDHIKAINRGGLKIYTQSDIIEVKNIKGYTGIREYKKAKNKIEEDMNNSSMYLFLSTKTYDMKKALREYASLTEGAKRVIILQNGIGNESVVRQFLSPKKIIRIITSNGAFLFEPGKVRHTGEGYTKIGAPFVTSGSLSITEGEGSVIRESAFEKEREDIQQDLIVLKNLLTVAGLETSISENIIRDSWEKIFVNIGINPFGALTGLKNGELIEDPHIKALMGDAVDEAVRVARAKGIRLSGSEFKALAYDVASKTAENKNSMLQDVLKGGQTEIDFINGRIVKYAEELNMEVPINRTVSYLVRGLKKS
ncbi:MAG: 2-dehydropantoate 2-reductase [Promethearchaeota archaeon]|nr:MAG: 2-dehydropantoate 2-reductase [Candidatus Lokiarchaeota archaeon]